MITADYLADCTATNIFIIKYFHLFLQSTKNPLQCCQAVLDNRLEVESDPPCTNIDFSISACLGATARKGKTKFS